MAGTVKGKQVRQYFLKCERDLRELIEGQKVTNARMYREKAGVKSMSQKKSPPETPQLPPDAFLDCEKDKTDLYRSLWIMAMWFACGFVIGVGFALAIFGDAISKSF